MNLPFNKRKQRGFSLLEVLVAFSILALSLGVLFQIYSRGSNVTALSRDYSKALIIAQSQLAALELEKELEFKNKSGTTEDGIHWQQRVFAYEDISTETQTRSSTKKYQLINVEVEVDWKTLGRPHKFTLKTLRLIKAY